MPAAAKDALQGLLAEGVEADEVLMRLSDAGYKVEPPAGDDSYGGEMPGSPDVVVELEEEEGDKPELLPMGGPQVPENRYTKAAKAAMRKDKAVDEEEEPMPDGP